MKDLNKKEEKEEKKEGLQPKTKKGNPYLKSSQQIMLQALGNYIEEVNRLTFMMGKKEKLSEAGKTFINLQSGLYNFFDTLKSVFMSEKINSNELQKTYNKDGFSKNRRSEKLQELISKDPQYAEIFARDLELNLKSIKNGDAYIRMERMLDYAKGIVEKDKQKTQLSNQQKPQQQQKENNKIEK